MPWLRRAKNVHPLSPQCISRMVGCGSYSCVLEVLNTTSFCLMQAYMHVPDGTVAFLCSHPNTIARANRAICMLPFVSLLWGQPQSHGTVSLKKLWRGEISQIMKREIQIQHQGTTIGPDLQLHMSDEKYTADHFLCSMSSACGL
jgi:hypothetical protein